MPRQALTTTDQPRCSNKQQVLSTFLHQLSFTVSTDQSQRGRENTTQHLHARRGLSNLHRPYLLGIHVYSSFFYWDVLHFLARSTISYAFGQRACSGVFFWKMLLDRYHFGSRTSLASIDFCIKFAPPCPWPIISPSGERAHPPSSVSPCIGYHFGY